jgi:hypothetical protein
VLLLFCASMDVLSFVFLRQVSFRANGQNTNKEHPQSLSHKRNERKITQCSSCVLREGSAAEWSAREAKKRATSQPDRLGLLL